MTPVKWARTIAVWLLDSATLAIPPMLFNAMLPWPKTINVAYFVAFIAVYVGFALAWMLLLSTAGYLRWRLYHVWRPGWRPCMCDKPTYCLRHRSSVREPNRPGVIAARLAKTGSEDA